MGRGLVSRLLRARRRRQKLSGDLEAEIETHLAQRTDELVAAGMDAESARAEAVRRFGDPTRSRRALYRTARQRDARLAAHEWVESVLRDASLAWRMARSKPLRATLTLAVFALGIGLTTSMFALVDHVLVRSLPFPDAHELVSLQSVDEYDAAFPDVSSANWYDWHTDNQSLEGSALYRWERVDVGFDGEARRVRGQRVSGGFFEVLGLSFVAGRPFTWDEAQEEGPVVVVSESFWRRELAARPLADLHVRIGGAERQVVGVVARSHVYPEGTQLWEPFRIVQRAGPSRNSINWFAVGRLREGVSMAQAKDDLDRIAERIRVTDPVGIYSWGVGVAPLHEFVVGGTAEQLLLLMGAVLLLLLLTCANLAGLSVAGVAGRAREMAIRAAIGAGRGRIVRQLVTEQIAWSLAGGTLGILLAHLGVALMAGSGEWAVPRAADATVDLRVAAFGIAVALAAGVVAGLPPGYRAAGSAIAGTMARWRGRCRSRRDLPGAGLVAAEMALAILLLTGGGLLVRSFVALNNRDLGFDPRQLVAVEITLPVERYAESTARASFWQRLLDEARSVAGVAGAGLANSIPGRRGAGMGFIEVEGVDRRDMGAVYLTVGPDYLETLGAPLLTGRLLNADDRLGTERVAVITQTMANRDWPGQVPIGRRVRALSMESWMYDGEAPWLTVVGVVGDIRSGGFAADNLPEMYVAYRQLPRAPIVMTLLLRVQGDTGAIYPELGRRLRALEPEVAFAPIELRGALADLLAGSRWLTSVLNGFALLVLLLAGIGLYGLVSYAAAARRQELAVRTALGSTRGGIVALMLRRSLRLVVVGASVGLLAATWASRLLRSLLVDIAPRDPLAFILAAGVLATVAVVATLVPAWRAARIDPAQALKAS